MSAPDESPPESLIKINTFPLSVEITFYLHLHYMMNAHLKGCFSHLVCRGLNETRRKFRLER